MSEEERMKGEMEKGKWEGVKKEEGRRRRRGNSGERFINIEIEKKNQKLSIEKKSKGYISIKFLKTGLKLAISRTRRRTRFLW